MKPLLEMSVFLAGFLTSNIDELIINCEAILREIENKENEILSLIRLFSEENVEFSQENNKKINKSTENLDFYEENIEKVNKSTENAEFEGENLINHKFLAQTKRIFSALQYVFSQFGRVIHYINIANSPNPKAAKLSSFSKNENSEKTGNSSKTGNFQKTENLSKTENLPKTENLTKTENLSKTEDLSKIENSSKTEDLSKIENSEKTAKNENFPKIDNSSKTENLSKNLDLSKNENSHKNTSNFFISSEEKGYEDYDDSDLLPEDDNLMNEIIKSENSRKKLVNMNIPLTFLHSEARKKAFYDENNLISQSKKKKSLDFYFKWKLQKWENLTEKKTVFGIPCRICLNKVWSNKLAMHSKLCLQRYQISNAMENQKKSETKFSDMAVENKRNLEIQMRLEK